MKNQILKEGYPLFSPVHLGTMAVCTGGLSLLTHHFLKLDKAGREKMARTVAGIPLVLEGIQDGVLLARRKMNAAYLPFHLCGQAMFLEPLHSRMKEGKRKEALGNMIYSLFLPGAAMALVFPGWNHLPLLSPISVKKYAAHFCLVLYGILIYADDEIKLKKRNIAEDLCWLYGSALLLWPFNVKFNTNYLYTHEPVDPLAGIWNHFGKPAYIALLMDAGLVLVLSMYGLDALMQRERL